MTRLPTTRILLVIATAVALAGCSLRYTVKEPEISSPAYRGNEIAPATLTIVDKRTGPDADFLVKVLGVGGAGSSAVSLSITNMQDPIRFFAQHLERELAGRGIPLRCVPGDESASGLKLLVNRYQIVNHRTTGFSPWETCHIFAATLVTPEGEKPIKAYFYNGKTPVWSMNEIEEPCFTIPVSAMIKDVASKINRAFFRLKVPDEEVAILVSAIDAEAGKVDVDPYRRPFWKVLSLGGTNNPAALEPLKRYSEDADEFFKACALSAIGMLGIDSELSFLMEKYASGRFNDKYMAAKAIGDLGTEAALKALLEMRRDPSYSREVGLKQCVDLYAP